MSKDNLAQLPARIRAKISVDPEGCWMWTGSVTRYGGYGQVWIDGGVLLIHRLAWELTHGPIPDGLKVLHDCDNPPCCNSEHLFLGTQADNMADMRAKGRHRFGISQGEKHGCAKLTAVRVRSLRMIRELGVSHRQLGNMFGVAHSTAARICRRELWKHVV